ncbi:MAG TPA: hypothetical protein VGF76_00895 [Polyangiaceae bacterium]|jgi:hypothetical protein
MPASGGTPTRLQTNAAPGSPLVTDGLNLYYVSSAGTAIIQSPVSGKAWVVFASEPASSLVLGAGYLYWTNGAAGTVKKRALTGGPVITIASGQSSPKGIALNADQVFWGVKNGLLSAPR